MNKKEIEKALRLLGVEFGVPFETIKAEYKNLAQAFHPDRYEAGSKRQVWASEKLIEINAAFEMLEEFFRQYPDGPPPSWFEEEQNSHETEREPTVEPEDGFCDWKDWQQTQGTKEKSGRQDKESQWQAEQEARQADLSAAHKKMNKEKFVFYAKAAVCVFVVCIWLGRVGAMEATKAMAGNEQQAMVEQQAYELERQGTNIDGFIWSTEDLQSRHANQFDELKQKNEKRSVDMWTSGLFSLALTGLVVWICLITPARRLLNKEEKNV